MIVRPLLHAVNPYEGFDSDLHPAELVECQDHSPHFNHLGKDAKLILEIGSWLGHSAIQWCDSAPEAEVVCLDTWLGTEDMWDTHDDELGLLHGYPQVYFKFLANIMRAGKQAQVTPMPMSSNVGLELLYKNGVKPDVVYVGRSHSFNAVREDLFGAMKMRAKLICGGGFSRGTAVREAVRSINHTCDWTLDIDGEFWILKPR